MSMLPTKITLTRHARQRLEERKDSNIKYDTKNLINSSCKWYNQNDIIETSPLYLHTLYMCRKSNQMGYITNGYIEVLYNKKSKHAITIIELKDKFKPLTKYLKNNNNVEENKNERNKDVS